MCIPGKKGNLLEEKKKVEIHSFLLAKYPVTKTLLEKVNGPMLGDIAKDSTPAVNVTWYDAIEFCNSISRESGLNECYSFIDREPTVICDWSANGYRLPTDAEWQYACKAGTSGFRYGEKLSNYPIPFAHFPNKPKSYKK